VRTGEITFAEFFAGRDVVRRCVAQFLTYMAALHALIAEFVTAALLHLLKILSTADPGLPLVSLTAQ